MQLPSPGGVLWGPIVCAEYDSEKDHEDCDKKAYVYAGCGIAGKMTVSSDNIEGRNNGL